MTNDEIEALLASGSAIKHEDGSIRWASGNSQDKQPGALVVRPPGAAPLIVTETATELARKRREARNKAIEDGFAEGISEATGGGPLTSDEALKVLSARLSRAALRVSDRDAMRAVQLLMEMMKVTGNKDVVVDQRKQTIEIDNAEFLVMRDWGQLPDKRGTNTSP